MPPRSGVETPCHVPVLQARPPTRAGGARAQTSAVARRGSGRRFESAQLAFPSWAQPILRSAPGMLRLSTQLRVGHVASGGRQTSFGSRGQGCRSRAPRLPSSSLPYKATKCFGVSCAPSSLAGCVLQGGSWQLRAPLACSAPGRASQTGRRAWCRRAIGDGKAAQTCRIHGDLLLGFERAPGERREKKSTRIETQRGPEGRQAVLVSIASFTNLCCLYEVARTSRQL